MLGRNEEKANVEVNPGPGQYETKEERKPGWSFPKEERDKAKVTNEPGPGAYEYDQNAVRVKKPEYTFAGKQEAKPAEKTPGPGEYEIKSTVGEGPKIFIIKNKETHIHLNLKENEEFYNIKLSI